MRFTRVALMSALTVSLATGILGQHRVKRASALNADKPSVYIRVVGFGKRESGRASESDQGVWLRLHNNSRWTLELDGHGIEGGGQEEVGMFVSVEDASYRSEFVGNVTPAANYPLPGQAPPAARAADQGLPRTSKEDDQRCSAPRDDRCHTCSLIRLPPGKSLLFSVAREDLCKTRRIYLIFKYSWENLSGEPQHRVYFYGSQLSH